MDSVSIKHIEFTPITEVLITLMTKPTTEVAKFTHKGPFNNYVTGLGGRGVPEGGDKR